MKFVNDRIRMEVKAVMKKRGLTQQSIADELGVDRVYVNQMLSGDAGQVPGRWAEMLNLLGLELTVTPADPEERQR